MTDKEYFLQAETEFESDNYDDAVLAKANHFSRGNKDNLKHKYIELRVEDSTENAARIKKDKIIVSKENNLINNIDNGKLVKVLRLEPKTNKSSVSKKSSIASSSLNGIWKSVKNSLTLK